MVERAVRVKPTVIRICPGLRAILAAYHMVFAGATVKSVRKRARALAMSNAAEQRMWGRASPSLRVPVDSGTSGRMTHLLVSADSWVARYADNLVSWAA